MSPLRLQLLNPAETPEQRRQRSVLYILAFCALVFACESAGVVSRQSDGAHDSSMWPVWFAAILTGLIALHIRMGLKETPSAAAPSAARGQTISALSDLAKWRNQRASTFSGLKLDFSTEDKADKSARSQSSNKRPRPKRKGQDGTGADPMAKALEDFVSRSNDHRRE